MSLMDDKRNVFTTIGAYTSLKQERSLPDATNLFPSVNNKKDIVPFLLDVLKVVVGSSALQDLTGKLLTDFVDNIEPQMKTALSKQLIQYNAGDTLPAYFKTTGISVPVKNIDVYGKFKSNPNSDTGSLLYDTSQPSFDNKAYDAIVNAGTEIPYNNILIKYNTTSDSFVFRANPASVDGTTTVGDWMGDFVNDTVIIKKKEFLTNVMNAVYGSVTTNQGKTQEEVYQELQVSKLIEQLIDDDDSFEISQQDFDELLEKAHALIDGVVYYDMGCGIIGAELPLSGMTEFISSVSGSTDSFAVGNAISATIDESMVNVQEVANENKTTIKDGFFQRLIRAITNVLAQALTTTPQVRTLLAILSATQNNGVVKIGNAKDDMKNFKVFLKCIIKEAMKLINEFIFNLVVAFLVALLVPIMRKIVREKINQYIGILKSLIT